MSTTASRSPIQYRGTSTNGSYYFCIEGLPKRYTWQDLKDLVRKEAAHGIWTEMAFFSNGQTGETGWARVQRQDEAGKLYKFLANSPVQGGTLRLHLFDTSASPPRLIAHTYGAAPCIANARSFEARPRTTPTPAATQPVTSTPMYMQQPTAYAVQPPSPYYDSSAHVMPTQPPPQLAPAYSMQALQTSMAGMRMDPADPAAVAAIRARMAQAYAQQVAAQQVAAQQVASQQSPTQTRVQSQAQGPVYVSSPTGTRVNIGHGVTKTEVRGVCVSNIDYKVGTRDLQRFFSRAGEIFSCQLQKDPATGKSKGNATVQYAAANDAKNAVRLFHNESALAQSWPPAFAMFMYASAGAFYKGWSRILVMTAMIAYADARALPPYHPAQIGSGSDTANSSNDHGSVGPPNRDLGLETHHASWSLWITLAVAFISLLCAAEAWVAFSGERVRRIRAMGYVCVFALAIAATPMVLHQAGGLDAEVKGPLLALWAGSQLNFVLRGAILVRHEEAGYLSPLGYLGVLAVLSHLIFSAADKQNSRLYTTLTTLVVTILQDVGLRASFSGPQAS